jgi:hypothetical protein
MMFDNSPWYKDNSFLMITTMLLVLIVLLFYLILIVASDAQKKENAKRALIDSLSCKDLGTWIIKNAEDNIGRNEGSNFAYASAKYLVCTHTASGETP